ncbi:phosphatase domain-containing putative toxin [Profundibacterium mesophilum]|uniref:Dual specificity protein phosphatase n=1 Tax=Profundibacterium mesophilum KAUST100406-0324 TaxID=1037889 RepID=A0A921NVI5_9RHOB|nr:hypothetical protein [Profundibacterium mesophilum]KAF0676413.1 Dual specificity protein phosphatase [Profundibacterium mesophilum KAUST100406-0324]
MEDHDEISIRARIRTPEGGILVMTGFPGLLIGHDGEAYIDIEAMDDTFAALVEARVGTLIVMAGDDELPEGAGCCLAAAAKRSGIAIINMPIEDFSTPSAEFVEKWRVVGPQLHKLLDRGDGCALSCHYGAGRSGMIAALMLMERGAAPDAAISTVRAHFDESIENTEQENWLRHRHIGHEHGERAGVRLG